MASVSILMNCYNSEKYLQETLESLFKQTYNDWQLIFVDNCSNDSSKAIFEPYMQDTRVKYLMTPHHMSLGEAREFGIKSCQGEYICFLDTDDLWVPDKLVKQVAFMEKHPEAQLCYSGCYYIDENSRITGGRDVAYKSGNLLGINLANYEINIQTLMIRKESLGVLKEPYFDSVLKFAEDYNLAMRLLACGPAVCQDERLVYYRKSSGSLTNKTIDLWGPEMEYTYNQLEKTGVLDTICDNKQRMQAQAKIAYYYAVSLMGHKDYTSARKMLKKNKYVNYKYYGLYFLSYYPKIWDWIHNLRK